MLQYRIVPDPDAESPRNDENLWHLHTPHRRCNYGDDGPVPEAEDSLRVPLYFYSHGQTMFATTPFGDRFDSGVAGFAILSWEKYGDFFGAVPIPQDWDAAGAGGSSDGAEFCTPRECALRILEMELKEYNAWLAGEYVGFEVFDDADPDDVLDSCGSFSDRDTCEADARQAVLGVQRSKAHRLRRDWIAGYSLDDAAGIIRGLLGKAPEPVADYKAVAERYLEQHEL